MTMSERDKKLITIILPLALVLAYWFLLLAPKREDAATAQTALTAQEQRRDAAQQRVDALASDRSDFAADYAELVRLGKAVPSTVDMPTLLVQLESAAGGTDIEWTRISAEARESAPTPAPAPPPAPGSGDGSQPAAAGGAPAQSAPGAAAETAGNTVANANQTSSSAEQSGLAPTDTQTSETAREGGLPVGGGTATPGTTTATGGVAPGLDTVPLSLDFTGNFFDLAAFFHRLKRYVETADNNVYVRGRLLTIEGVEFKSDPENFPKIEATLTANVYLSPVAEGVTAGATPGGPAPAPTTTVDAGDTSGSPLVPTATATR
jgi:hypothetical protein